MVEEQTGKTPDALLRKPKDDDVVLQYIEFYRLLRQFADKETGRINFSDMVLFANVIKDDPLEFVEIMVHVDKRFVQEMSQKSKGVKKRG